MSPEIEVILTHEHTDFDALASLLGASLLDPDAFPVLPQRLNRNVGEFFMLYKNQLPFVFAKELPKAHVARATLVDTDSANWTRGMDKRTTRFIIDHHSSDAELPAGVERWTDEVGANTTMLVEKLIERKVPLTPVQATLLALGIHEDTGSLTYASTTARDAQCLAWLLAPERGVNLAEVGRYLNHPMTEAQRALFEELIEQSEFLNVGGHSIVIAQATAEGFEDEVSALASRMRDFHETDAIFLVIDLGDMVQVVARSSTDEVDVGAAMRALGGGGHTRAAAASISGRDLTAQAVRDQVAGVIPAVTGRALTVRDIMSVGRPQMLDPEMSIEEAYTLMQRWGHEGFPVIKARADGSEELLGVLTRREADRAINHGMGDQPVQRFMRTGEVHVTPDDAIPLLRRTMIDSNWGQIPVMDEHGRIMGIVTRTDLIKLWDDTQRPERDPDNIPRKLESSLPPLQHHLLELVGREVDRLDYTVYVVGGFVRDLLLDGRSGRVLAFDMDVVIEGDAIAFAEQMQALYGGRIVRHERFRTAKWLLNDPDYPVNRALLLADADVDIPDDAPLPDHLDFVTARTEFYTAPTVLPTVESSSIKLDLHRRDFTINTLALCLNPSRWGELLDTYGGLNDLDKGLVRVLHSLSFVDDPTRILRAVRYEQRFDFEIDSRTLELLDDALDLLEKVTPARVRHELERILEEEIPEKALVRLDELGVLGRLQETLTADDWLALQFQRLRDELAAQQPDPNLLVESIQRLYFGLLTYRMSEAADAELIERLGLRGETQRLVEGLEALRVGLDTLRVPGIKPSEAVRILDRTNATARSLVRLIEDDPGVTRLLDEYERVWKDMRAELDGNDLAAMGVPKGPVYGQILTDLRAGRLDGDIRSREEEVARVEQMLSATEDHEAPPA